MKETMATALALESQRKVHTVLEHRIGAKKKILLGCNVLYVALFWEI